MIYWQVICQDRISLGHGNKQTKKNLSGLTQNLFSLTNPDEDLEILHGKQCHEMSRDAGCLDLPSPSIQHKTFSTTAVVRKKILESQTLAVKYFGLKVTPNMPAHNSFAKTNWTKLVLAKPKVECFPIFEGEEIYIWKNRDVSTTTVFRQEQHALRLNSLKIIVDIFSKD